MRWSSRLHIVAPDGDPTAIVRTSQVYGPAGFDVNRHHDKHQQIPPTAEVVVSGPGPARPDPGDLSWVALVEQLLPHAADVLDPVRRQSCPAQVQALWNELERRVARIATSRGSGMQNLLAGDEQRQVVRDVLAELLGPGVPEELRRVADEGAQVKRRVRRAARHRLQANDRMKWIRRAVVDTSPMDPDLPVDPTTLRRVQAVIARLSRKDRDLLEAAATRGMTTAEIVRQSRVARRLFRLLKRVLDALEEP